MVMLGQNNKPKTKSSHYRVIRRMISVIKVLHLKYYTFLIKS